MKRLLLTIGLAFGLASAAHPAALGDSYIAFCQACGGAAKPIQNAKFFLPGWMVWQSKSPDKTADLYCNFENGRAQSAIYRFRTGKSKFFEAEIWRILAIYSPASPWHEQSNPRHNGRLFISDDNRMSATLTQTNDVLAVAYNSWLLRHYVYKQPAKIQASQTGAKASKGHPANPASREPRLQDRPLEQLVPEPQDIFSGIEQFRDRTR